MGVAKPRLIRMCFTDACVVFGEYTSSVKLYMEKSYNSDSLIVIGHDRNEVHGEL